MIRKVNKRIAVSAIVMFLLLFLAYMENSSYIYVMNSMVGGEKFYSIFDRVKFFLPMTLMLSITSDYSAYMLRESPSICATRFKGRKKFASYLLENLYIICFIFCVLTSMFAIALSFYFENTFSSFYVYLLFFINGYTILLIVVFTQVLIEMISSTQISVILMISILIFSTLVSSEVKYLLILPIGMGLYNFDIYEIMVRIALIITIITALNFTIYKKIRRKDLI